MCSLVGSNAISDPVPPKQEELATTTTPPQTTVEQIENEYNEETTDIAVEPVQAPPHHKKKKKGKKEDVLEDDSIGIGFAQQLDISCSSDSPVTAPDIDDAFVSKYARQVPYTRSISKTDFKCCYFYQIDEEKVKKFFLLPSMNAMKTMNCKHPA